MAFVAGTNALFTNTAAVTLSDGGIRAGNITVSNKKNNNYSGGTLLRRGIPAANAASLQGNITNNASLVFDQSGSGTFTGSISGKGKLSNTGSRSVTLSGINSLISGKSITGSGLKEINLSGSFLNGAMLALGESTNFDGYEYTFTNSKTALELKVSDAAVVAADIAFIQVQTSGAGSIPTEAVDVDAVPEPSDYTLLVVGLGLGAVLVIVRRRLVS